MKNQMRRPRFLAMVLALALLLQQTGIITLANETEFSSGHVTETRISETKQSESAVSETDSESSGKKESSTEAETKATEASISETLAAEQTESETIVSDDANNTAAASDTGNSSSDAGQSETTASETENKKRESISPDRTIGLENYIQSVVIRDEQKNEMEAITPGESFYVFLDFEIEASQLKDEAGNWVVDKITYQLPSNINPKEHSYEGTLKNKQGDTVGTYEIKDGQIIFSNLNYEKLDGTTIWGDLYFDAVYKSEETDEDGEVVTEWTGDITTATFIKKEENLTITKSGSGTVTDTENGILTFTYTLNVTSSTGTTGTIDIEDQLLNYKTITERTDGEDGAFVRTAPVIVLVKADGTKVTMKSPETAGDAADYGYTDNTETASIIGLPALKAGEQYEITYTTVETLEEAQKQGGVFEEKNSAAASTTPKYQDKITTNTVKSNPKVEYYGPEYADCAIQKTGSGAKQDDQSIIWTYTVTVSSEHGTAQKPIHFRDILTSTPVSGVTSRYVGSISVTKNGQDVTGSDGQQSVTESWTIQDQESDCIKYGETAIEGDLPALEAGESYQITYTIVEKTIPEDFNQIVFGSNKASIQVEDGPGAEKEIYPSVSYVKESTVPSISKNGTLSADQSTITWTITVNQDRSKSLIGYEVSDQLLKDQTELAEAVLCTVKINDSTTYSNVKLPVTFVEESGSCFMEDADGRAYALSSEKDKVTFTYTTDVELNSDAFATAYKNTGTISNGEQSSESSKNVIVGTPVLDKEATEQETLEDGTYLFHWQAVITVPGDGIKAGAIYKDKLSAVTNISNTGYITGYFTKEQLQAITVDDLQAEDYELKASYITADNIYWTRESTLDAIPDDAICTGFAVTFKKTILQAEKDKLVITYTSTGDMNSLPIGTELSFANNGEFTQDNVTVKDQDSFTVKKKGQGERLVSKYNYTSSGNSVTDLSVASPSGEPNNKVRLYYRVVLNESGAASGTMTYTDVLPEHTELVMDSWTYGTFTYQPGNQYYWSTGINGVGIRFQSFDSAQEENSFMYRTASERGIQIQYNKESRTISVEVPESAYVDASSKKMAQVILYYALDVTLPEGTDITGNNTYVVTNTGSVSTSGSDAAETSTATATIETPHMEKIAKEYNAVDNTISFQATINPKAQQKGDTEELVIYDVLDYSAIRNKVESIEIVPGTLKLYTIVDGEREYLKDKITVHNDSEAGKCEMILYVPNEATYYLEYTYQFDYNTISAVKGDVANTITVSGEYGDNWSSSTNTSVVELASGGTMNAEYTTLSLVKRDADNMAEFLAGAAYTLEKYTASSEAEESEQAWKTIGIFTTDENGVVTIGETSAGGDCRFYYNHLYRLKEVSAPEGYAAEEDYIYVYLKNDKISYTYYPKGFDLSIARSDHQNYLYLDDVKTEHGRIEVQKIWKDSAGSTIDAPEGAEVTVTLWQTTSESEQDTAKAVQAGQVVFNASNGWSAVFEDLPLSDGTTTYHYFVTETVTGAEGYLQEITPSESITNGAFEITNSQPETKPETEPETKPETEPETKPETEPETKPETEPETKPETKPETEPETQPETKPQTEPETQPETPSVNDQASVKVTKRLVLTDGTLIAAPEQSFYVALYSDAACTKRVTQVKEIKFKNASVSTVTFTNLEKNRIYYVGETDADGNTITRGSVADGETFVTDFANGNQVVTKQGETVGLTFDNCFYTLPREYYKQGTLRITKKLLDADGTPKASEETFYAGIFADEAYTVLSDDVSQNIVPLSLGGGTEVTSETIYTALDENGSKTLYVTEVDAQGNPVDGSAGFIYKMTVDQTSVTIREGSEASVTITNQETRASEALEDTESYEESIEEDETKEEKQTEQAKSVQTGDETPIGMYTFLLIASALLLFSEERKRRLGRQIER